MTVSKKSDPFSMVQERIRIEKIRAKALYEFASRVYDRTKRNEIIPIGKDRALAYANNPCADENDIGLLVAYLGKQCIGYLGIMPGLLKKGVQFSKVHWLSTWFVAPEARKMSVALQLIFTALSLKYDFVVCGMSDEAEKIYRALRFHELRPLKYYVINLEILNLLNLALRFLRKIIRKVEITFDIPDRVIRFSAQVYSPIKKALYRVLMRGQRYWLDRISYQEVREFDNEIRDVKCGSSSTEFYRGIEVINWMLKHKWTKERAVVETSDHNYYFSEIRDVFKFVALKVFSLDGMEYKGFLVLSFSAKGFYSVVKILDFYFYSCKDYEYIPLLALKYARKYEASCLEIPEDLMMYMKGSPILRILLRKRRRVYLFHPKDSKSPLATLSSEIDLNYLDGDTPFT